MAGDETDQLSREIDLVQITAGVTGVMVHQFRSDVLLDPVVDVVEVGIKKLVDRHYPFSEAEGIFLVGLPEGVDTCRGPADDRLVFLEGVEVDLRNIEKLVFR